MCPSITTEVVDEQLGTRVEDNEANEDSARVHESSTHVAGSPGTETAAVSAVHLTIPAEHSSQSLENLLKLERDKNEELRKQILSLRVELPCRKCKIYEEETKKMISTLRLFEAESRELKAKINSSNFKISNDKIYLQKESDSTAAPAEEGVAFTVVTKKNKGTNIGGICILLEMLDISNMDRSHFTPHCLHLRASGKQLMADLILQRISGMMPRPRRRVTAVTAPIRSTPSPTPDPVTLPYSTYAEAVIGTSQPLTTDILNASMKTVSKNCLVMSSAKIE
ncbi:hypothetical protein J6590_058311 [Homalodisca vitripennis]|nr:hypothetical protein J6590_058311 [Homalodisca vitripennis]